MRRICGTLFFCVTIALCASPAHAILTNAILLVNSPHARTVAMGDIGVADNSDPSTIFFNPANVCGGSRVYVTAAQLNFQDDFFEDGWFRSGRAGFSWQSKSSTWTVGLDAAYTKFTLGEFPVDFEDSLSAKIEYYQDILSFALGAGFRAADIYDFRFGVGVERWRAHYPEQFAAEPLEEVSTAAFNVGFAFAVHERYGAWNIVPTVGASMMDMGDDIEWSYGDKLPTRANFGASVRIESAPCEILSARVPLLAVIAAVDGIKPKDWDFEWGIGNEIAVAQVLFIRTGVHRYATYSNSLFETTSETRASWGVGLGIPAGKLRTRLDYGRQPPANFSVIGDDEYHLSALVQWTF